MIRCLGESESRRLAATKSALVPRPPSSRVPLSFQQLWWWNYLEALGPCMSARYFAVVLRLRGRLNVEALRRSLAHVVRRHESLRTRIIVVDGVPMQEIDAVPEQALEMLDVSAAGASVESEAKRLVEALVNEPIPADIGPLFGARLLKLADREYVFVLALNHVITDHVSEHVLLRDIWASYVQFLLVRPLSLPPMPVQYGDYAIWQRGTHESWLAKHGHYWESRLENAPGASFPVKEDARPAARYRYAQMQISFGQTITERLRQLSKRYRTTLVMSVLTGYVALALRWRQSRDLAIGCLVSGRNCQELDNSIGFFASVLHLRIKLSEGDTFADLMRGVTREFCAAYEHYDAARLSVPMPGPEYRGNTTLNWLPRLDGRENSLSDLEGSEDALALEPFEYCNRLFDIEWEDRIGISSEDPALMLSDPPEGISGFFYYRTDLFGATTMEKLGRNFRLLIEQMLDDPNRIVESVEYEQ
jgi:Condensation domain